MSINPYEPSEASIDPLRSSYRRPVKPGVVTWHNVYCVLMALLYLGVAILGVVFTQLDPADLNGRDFDRMDRGPAGPEIQFLGYIYAGIGVPLMVVFGVAPLLPRRPWVWIYGFVTIGIGLTSVCCLPATIPLLIFWIKAETKAYFR